MREDRQHYGIICKIMLCEPDAGVYNNHLCPECGKDDYRDLMRNGLWRERYSRCGKLEWEWGTPSDYMNGGRTKLLLYDRHEKAITVDVDVIPDKMCIEECDCPSETKVHFHYRNILNHDTLRVLKDPIPRERIQKLPGFKNFNTKGDRTSHRLISKADYEFLTANGD